MDEDHEFHYHGWFYFMMFYGFIITRMAFDEICSGITIVEKMDNVGLMFVVDT